MEFSSPCSLFTATEVIRTVIQKCQMLNSIISKCLGSGKPVRASPLLLVNRLGIIQELHPDLLRAMTIRGVQQLGSKLFPSLEFQGAAFQDLPPVHQRVQHS